MITFNHNVYKNFMFLYEAHDALFTSFNEEYRSNRTIHSYTSDVETAILVSLVTMTSAAEDMLIDTPKEMRGHCESRLRSMKLDDECARDLMTTVMEDELFILPL